MPTPIPGGGPLVVLADVRDAYEGDLGADKDTWVTTKIDQAERLLHAQRPALRVWLEQGRITREAARDAIVTAVLRVVRNPSGFASEGEDSYNYAVQRDVAGGKLYFTGDDLSLVTPPVPAAVGNIAVGLGPLRRGWL